MPGTYRIRRLVLHVAGGGVSLSTRQLAIAMGLPGGADFEWRWSTARSAGATQLGEIHVQWDEIETEPGRYRHEALETLDTLLQPLGLTAPLTISPIHTNRLTMPADLAGRRVDDPEVLARFQGLLDWVFDTVRKPVLDSLVVGNEFDVLLGDDADAWQSFSRLFASAADHVRRARPGLPVAAEVTYAGLLDRAPERMARLNAEADTIGVSYYPLLDGFQVDAPEVVGAAFDRLAAAYPGRTVRYYQFGYPSSELCGSSEQAQAAFFAETFKRWDDHPEIELIAIDWLGDIGPEHVQHWVDFYGVPGDAFGGFLGSLGLLRSDGAPKPALDVLRSLALSNSTAGP